MALQPHPCSVTDPVVVRSPVALVAFDLDGTIVRGGTTCLEAVAAALGRGDELAAFADIDYRDAGRLAAAREQVAAWFAGLERSDLVAPLAQLPLASGAREAFALLRSRGVSSAIVSVTWEFAVEWYARLLGADAHIGTRLEQDGTITHFGPADKRQWLSARAQALRIPSSKLAAIGDSDADFEMLALAGRAIHVGARAPALPHLWHFPDGDLATAVELLLGEVWPPEAAAGPAANVR